MDRKASLVVLAVAVLVGLGALLYSLRGGKRDDRPEVPGVLPASPRQPREVDALPERVARAELAPESKAGDAPAAPPAEFVAPEFVSTPPGVVEVAVYLGQLPARGARVELLPQGSGSFESGEARDADGEPLAADAYLQATTDEHGLARWEGMAAGNHELSVTLADGARLFRHAEVWEGNPSTRVIVRFGASSIGGTVYDANGLPLVGARVWVLQNPAGWGNDAVRRTTSAADGSYLVAGLEAGRLQVRAAPPEGRGRAPGLYARVELEANAHLRVDLGAPGHPVNWRGRLRLPSGAALEEPLLLSLRESSWGWQEDLPCDESGAFELQLLPGRYLPTYFAGYTRRRTELPPVEVGAIDLAHDLELPPACLRLEVAHPGARDGNVSVQLVPAGEDPAAHIGFSTRGTRLFLAGVPAGRYEVRVYAHEILGYGTRPVPLVIAPGQELVELVIEATRTAR
jgi:carboxypeptidase family protein